MSLTIDLPPELESRVNEAAYRNGQNPAEFVRAAVEEKLGGDDWRSRMSSLLTRAEAHAASMPGSPAQIDAEVQEACEAVRAEHYEERLRKGAG